MKSSILSLLATAGIALLSTSSNAQVVTAPMRALRGLEGADSEFQWSEELPASLSMSMKTEKSSMVGGSEAPPAPAHKDDDGDHMGKADKTTKLESSSKKSGKSGKGMGM